MNLHSKSLPKGAHTPSIIIHGGAGVRAREGTDPVRIAEVHTALGEIVAYGGRLLSEGASALHTVEAVVRELEDNPLFNAGRGAALTSEATIEHDASIMDGRDRRCGAVAAVGCVRNPISLARAIMEDGRHVLLAGPGAEQFARTHDLELAAPWYFFTPERFAALENVKKKIATAAEHELSEQDIHGTVGAVALDTHGDLAAATSTGGRANKLPGRVGDSAVIGAGTYADNRFCALSATGSGEQFSRVLFGRRVADLVELSGMDIEAACATALAEVQSLGGTGGFVGLSPAGEAVSRFSGKGMHRAYMRVGTPLQTAIYRDEPFGPDHISR